MTEFLEAVREKRQPETHVAEHIRSLALPLAVMESARRGAAVDLSEFTDFLKRKKSSSSVRQAADRRRDLPAAADEA
jgi:hypothetical protein